VMPKHGARIETGNVYCVPEGSTTSDVDNL